MKNINSIQELRAFDQEIWDKVQEYINDYEDYDDDVVLAINDKNYEVVIDSAKNLSDDYVQYDLSELIRHDEQGSIEPDCDATNELANKYFFVR